VHTRSPFADFFGAVSKRRTLMSQAISMIGHAGSGVMVVINRSVITFFSGLVEA